MHVLIIIIAIVFQGCTSDLTRFLNYKQLEQKTDTTIISHSLETVGVIRLEENYPIILNEVYSVDIDGASNRFLITDPPSKYAVQFDYNKGRIISTLKAGLYLSDSVAYSGRSPYQAYYMGNKSFKYIKSTEYSNYKIGDSDIKLFQTSFWTVRYIGAKIFLLTFIHTPAVNKDLLKITDNTASLVLCNDSLKIKKVIVFENFLQSHSIPYDFQFKHADNSYYVTTSSFPRFRYEKKYDSLAAIANFDSSGNQLVHPTFLPDIYNFEGAGYNIPFIPSIINCNEDFYITYPKDLQVFGLNNSKRFKLENLPFSNDTGFIFLKDIEEYYSKGTTIKNMEDHNKTLAKILPVTIIRMISMRQSICVQILIMDPKEKNGYYYILQEYDKSGKLMSHTKVMDDLTNPIKLITYDKYNGYVVFIRKSKEGWSLEKRRWE